ncbi:MAG: hypothetical protein ACWA41_09310 [Putridiphycobacter sp.]
MKKTFLLLFFSVLFSNLNAQTGCFEEWKKVFEERGAYTVADDMHRKVIISFIENGESYCVYGKVRVENGRIVSVFVQYEDGEYELMDGKVMNKQKMSPTIKDGISEEITNDNGEHFYVLFIEKIKPKKKSYKSAGGPGAEFK